MKQQPARKRWRDNKVIRISLTLIVAIIVAIPLTNLLGFFGFLLVAAGTSYMLIRALLPREKRGLLLFIWEIACTSGFFATLFYESASASAAIGNPGWFGGTFMPTVAGRVIGSLILGTILGGSIIVLPTLLQAYTGVVWVLALDQIYGITRWQALLLTLCLILNIQREMVSIEDGQVKKLKAEGWPVLAGGPGLVIIRPYNAVVFEQAGRVTRVEGPGVILMAFEERIKAVIDLRRQAMQVSLEQVLTRDRVPLHVKGGVGFRVQTLDERIKIDPKVRARLRKLDGVSFPAAGPNSTPTLLDTARILRQTIYDVAYETRLNQKWTERVQGDLDSEIRKVFRMYNFNEIYDLDDPKPKVRATFLEEIIQKVNDGVKANAQQYGVFVFGASIRTIQFEQDQRADILTPVDNLKSAYFSALLSEWRKRAQVTQASADRITLSERATEQGRIMLNQFGGVLQQYITAIQGMATPGQPPIPPEVMERFLRVSSQLLENVINDQSTARQYLDTMGILAQVSPTTIVAAGMDVSQVTDMAAAGLVSRPK